MSMRVNVWDINQVTLKCQMGTMGKTCQKRSKTEKLISPSDFTCQK